MSTGVRTGALLVTALLVQVAVVPWIAVAGVQLDLMLLCGVAAGLASGPERGARVGFVAGLMWDLVVSGPFGLSALCYCLAGWFVGSAQRSVVGPTWWAPIPGAALASAGAVGLYAGVGVVLGHQEWIDPQTLKIAVVVGITNGILCLPAIRLFRWTEGEALGVRLPRRVRRGSFARRGSTGRLATGWRR
jgi:rod shape-determining protein MreD